MPHPQEHPRPVRKDLDLLTLDQQPLDLSPGWGVAAFPDPWYASTMSSDDLDKLRKEAKSKKAMRCDYCRYIPKNLSDYVAHLKRAHPEGEKR